MNGNMKIDNWSGNKGEANSVICNRDCNYRVGCEEKVFQTVYT